MQLCIHQLLSLCSPQQRREDLAVTMSDKAEINLFASPPEAKYCHV